MLTTIFNQGGGGGQTVTLGRAVETDTAQTLGRAKTKALGQATETGIAQSLTSAKRAPIGQTVDDSVAFAMTVRVGGAVEVVGGGWGMAIRQTPILPPRKKDVIELPDGPVENDEAILIHLLH